jgi:hypothetical protein
MIGIVFIILANAGGHRTPDGGRDSDCCLKVKRSCRIHLNASQGFGGPVCSAAFILCVFEDSLLNARTSMLRKGDQSS